MQVSLSCQGDSLPLEKHTFCGKCLHETVLRQTDAFLEVGDTSRQAVRAWTERTTLVYNCQTNFLSP